MNELTKSMAEVIEKLEAEGKNAKNLAELEQVVMYSQELSQTAYQEPYDAARLTCRHGACAS